MSSAVSLKSLVQTPPPTVGKKPATATTAPDTIRPHEIVLRPIPLRRYFE